MNESRSFLQINFPTYKTDLGARNAILFDFSLFIIHDNKVTGNGIR